MARRFDVHPRDPQPHTFIVKATREVPRRLSAPKKRTVGARIPDHPFVRALLRELDQPLVSTTLLLAGDAIPMTDGRQIQERLGQVVVWSQDSPEVVRIGVGDPARFLS